MKLFQLFNSERDQLKKARTVFTAWPTNFPSVPGRTNERTSAYTVTSPVTTKSDQGRQVSFNPINFHDTLHGTRSSTTRIFPLLHLASVLRREEEEEPLLLPFPITIEGS